MSTGEDLDAPVGLSAHTNPVDLKTLGAAREYWREEVQRWVFMQLALGLVAFILPLGFGIALATVARESRDQDGDDLFSAASLLESFEGLGELVNTDGVGVSLGILQVVIAIAIALIASRFPAMDNVLDAVAVTYWSRRLKLASAVVSAVTIAMALASATYLVWALTGCRERCADVAPLTSLILCLSAGVCVAITAASRVTGIDRAGEDLLLLEMEDLLRRLPRHAERLASPTRLRAPRMLSMSPRQRRWGSYGWPFLIGLVAIIGWMVAGGPTASSDLATSPRWSYALLSLAAWLSGQVGIAVLIFAGQTILQPAWVSHYQTGRGKVSLWFAITVAAAVVLVGTFMSFAIGWSSLEPAPGLWNALLFIALVAPGLPPFFKSLPRRMRQDGVDGLLRPHRALEDRVLGELDAHLEWLGNEHTRRTTAHRAFVQDGSAALVRPLRIP